MRLHRTTVDLTVFTAEVEVVDKKRSAELLRTTMKEPPPQLKYHLIYVSTLATHLFACLFIGHVKTGKAEYDQSVVDQNDQTVMCGSIFQGLRADLNGLVNLISIVSISADLRLFPGLCTRVYSLSVSISLCYTFCRP